MSTQIHNHVREHGTLPKIKITNWGDYISFSLQVGDHNSTSFLYPAEGESTGEFIARIRAEFADLNVQVEDRDKYVISLRTEN